MVMVCDKSALSVLYGTWRIHMLQSMTCTASVYVPALYTKATSFIILLYTAVFVSLQFFTSVFISLLFFGARLPFLINRQT